jgi:calcium/proton exchanger cax
MSAPEPPTMAASENTSLLEHGNVDGEQQLGHPEERHSIQDKIKNIERETLRTIRGTLFCSWANLLLFCVPLGFVAGKNEWNSTAVFVLNFLAIFPLAEILSYSTEELSASVGQILGGLINATFGNAVEMIVSRPSLVMEGLLTDPQVGITALKEGEIGIVQSAMIGSILSGMLLVWPPYLSFCASCRVANASKILGSCFFAGGLRHTKLEFNVEVAGIMSSLMIVSSASLVVPSAFSATYTEFMSAGDPTSYILSLSRATSIILLLFYGVYLYFSVKSHRHLFCEEETTERQPLDPWAASVVLIITTIAVAVCSDYLVDSVDGFVETLHVSRAFIGLIIVPIVGNAGEFAATVKWAINGKLDLAIGVIVGSTLQIALFVIPFMVILGWIIGQDMSLQFDPFQTTTVSLSVLVVNCLVRDGRTNYFEGFLLIVT